jgi:predicted component of type VI protein secretion system
MSKRVKINFETINKGRYEIIPPEKVAESRERIKQNMKAREYNSQLLQELLEEVTPLEMERTKYEMLLIARIEDLIENLTEQLDKVVKEHPIEVSEDTYWRGVKIGLETAIELARTINTNEK